MGTIARAGTVWWIAAACTVAFFALALFVWRWSTRRSRKPVPLPSEWTLTARPVFSADERRVYKLVREALPHHVVLSKLPLIRFTQPNDPNEVRYWFNLLGSIHIAFAICSANGRVLAAIDLDNDDGHSRRALQIKQSVLGACRVRYLRCPIDNLPSAAELQLLVPGAAASARGPQPATSASARGLGEARDSLASAVATRRAQRTALWQDSSLFQDSFFGLDSRLDVFGNSEFQPMPRPSAHGHPAPGQPRGTREPLSGQSSASPGDGTQADADARDADPGAANGSRSRC